MLAADTTLGPYRILAPLGAGGMGEVYRARDTRLGRDVAIKVLAPHLAATPEVHARFEREARTISQLNHPHICTLHDIGREGNTDYLVMELLEGETLVHRLEKGPLPVSEVLTLGAQIADALDRAHRAGVVHRDLKPGNVMLTKAGVKLMDFGLARHVLAPAAMPESPTMSKPITAEGTIVGTFQYMAPEQLEGREADVRSDIWALGCVLYEMATGKRAFEGKSQASLISAIMKDEPPPIVVLRPLTPPALEHLVRQCLAKDPDERLQTAHDVKLQLQWIAEASSQAGVPAPVAARRRHRERLAWVLAAVALVAVAGLGWVVIRARAPEPRAIQAVLDAPHRANLAALRGNVAISPDGQTIVFLAFDTSGTAYLWARPLESDAARQIPGTTNAWLPFWSPDSRFVAFFDNQEGKLKKISMAGGSPMTICPAPDARGGTWSRDGVIIFAPASGPLQRVSSAGGEPVAVTALDTMRHDTGHRFPCFLPDGRHFLFASLAARQDVWDIRAGDLGSREVKQVLRASSAPIYAEPGYLLFERDKQMMAQRFNARRVELVGEPIAIANAPEQSGMLAEPVASVSGNGRLVMLRSSSPDNRLDLLDRSGAVRTRYGLPQAPWHVVAAAPGGARALVANGGDLWIVDLARSAPMRFPSGPPFPGGFRSAVWSPQADRIAYVTIRGGREEISIAGPDGQGEPIATTEDRFKWLNDWSSDGRYIVFTAQGGATRQDIWVLPLEGDRKPFPYLRSASGETTAGLSPDGRWLAYVSDESGRYEVYVQSFPQPGRKVRVSLDGGDFPLWAKGGRELLYIRGSTLVSVPLRVGELVQPEPAHVLFALSPDWTGLDVMANGERFLVSTPTETSPRDIRLILNWRALLKR